MGGSEPEAAFMHRCLRCGWFTYDFEALCRVCGWDQWNDTHTHGWWGNWLEITGRDPE